ILFDGVEVPYAPVKDRIKKFYRNGNSWTNTVSVSSGGEKGGFNLSFSNMTTTSIVPNSGFDRKTINLGFVQDISKKLKVSGNISYSREDNHNPPVIGDQDLSTPTTIFTLSNSMPLDLLKAKRHNDQGNEYAYSRFTNRTNPYFSVYDRFENIKRNRFFGNITTRYDITDWLYIQGRVGQDFYVRDQDYNFPTGMASGGTAQPGFVNGQYVQDSRRFSELNADFLVGANRKFGNIGLDLTFGGNQMRRRSELNSVLVQEFVVRGLYTVMNGRVKDPTYTLLESQINSLYGAAEVSYKDYLFLNATLRNDWFSTLSPGQRSIPYPSVTGSFVFSQAFQSFPSWITFGKVRAAYAEVGSDSDIGPYSNNLFYGVNANFFPAPDGSPQPVATIPSTTIPNPNLKPMRVKEVEFGIAMRMFQDRLSFDAAYYSKTTVDQILNVQVSDGAGYISRLINVGESRNNGLELLVTGVPVQTPDFRWELTVNGAHNKTEVLNLGSASSTGSVTVGTGLYDGELRQVVGEPLGQLYGYGYLRDEQGRQVFNETSGLPMRSATPISFGSAIPTLVGGIGSSFEYKGIQFSVLVDFKLGHKMISLTNYNAYRHGLHKSTLVGREEGFVIGDGVNPDGGVNETPAQIQPYYSEVRTSRIVEEFVYDAGFWKLRQLTLGYDFTKFLPKSLFIKSLRISAVANNVLLLKKSVDNIDPESFGFSSDSLIGLEATGIPTTRNIGFNLNVKF
ncbi:MAG TPA: TonB-dependent receptor, partial [Ohtaekwangia sp.]|nr:TonB-dependent receptor [Ohtaekwangia sp.]